MVNLSSFLKYHAQRWPENTAIVYEDSRISYGALWERVSQLARFLSEQGIGKGDVVAVFMKNSPAFIEIACATSYLGAVFLPINYRLATDEVAYIVGNANASLLIGDAEFDDILQVNIPKHVLSDAMQENILDFTGVEDAIPEPCYLRPDDLFRLMYTSGTTDRPKGVMHSYDNFYWKSMEHVVVLGLSQQTRLLVTGPLYHVGAFDLPGMAVLWSLAGTDHARGYIGASGQGKLRCSQSRMVHWRGGENAGRANPRISKVFYERSIYRRLRPDGILQWRYFYGARLGD